MRGKYMTKFNILLKPLSLNTPSQKVYIIHNKAMKIMKLVHILCTTEYNH